jgi:colanic acid/amylovoran biosynthesis glycosyltransferase
MSGTPASVLAVAHRIRTWLPPTENWVDVQVRHLPATVDSHVLCEREANLDRFPAPQRLALARHRADWLLRRGARALGLRAGDGPERRYCRAHGIGLLHSHFGDHAWAGVPLARALGVPHVATFYGFDVNQLPLRAPAWRARYRELFATVARVLCEGPHMAQCVRALGAPADKVRVHHLGVELDRIAFRPRQWRAGEPLRVLMAASFREKKGLPYGIEALKAIARDTPVELTLIGDAGADAASRAEKARIDAALAGAPSGLAVARLGYVAQARLHEEAARSHLFLSPSVTAADGDTEGGAPVAMIEMAAQGLPVVSTRHCDIPGVMPAAWASRLAPERDVEALVGSLRGWLRDADDWPALLAAGRAHVEREFDAATQGLRLAQLYAEVAR